MSIRFDRRVAIVTGAGHGLGRQHALALAARGAAVVVNDLGGSVDGNGGAPAAAQVVAEEIRAAGGRAIASAASVTDFAAVEAMVATAMQEWGRVDILVNNAGILRDKASPRWNSRTSGWSWTCTSWALCIARRPSGTSCASATTGASS
jgi:NAD(P)-dependent dehydrogenase (short-subunit alcohol dehydrogenase family)